MLAMFALQIINLAVALLLVICLNKLQPSLLSFTPVYCTDIELKCLTFGLISHQSRKQKH